MDTRLDNLNARKNVTLVGCGAIGSQAVGHLARCALQSLVLIDFDQVELKNVRNQNFLPSDVGRAKVEVLAAAARSISPSLQVHPICDRIENVPLGRVRSSVILVCTDSRISRQSTSSIAWRLGVPLVEAAVGIADPLARVSVFRPGADNPCLECTWSDDDYAELEQSHPCGGAQRSAAAPSSLGALAAAVASAECAKIIESKPGAPQVSRQRLIGLGAGEHLQNDLIPNAQCRFDHTVWAIEPICADPAATSLAQLAAHGPAADLRGAALRVEGHRFVRALTCRRCLAREDRLVLSRCLSRSDIRCSRCGGAMLATALDQSDLLSIDSLDPQQRDMALAQLGIEERDVVCVRTDRWRHFELAGDCHA